MTGSLFGRMRRVVAGNLESLVETAERHSSGALMRDALREMDRLIEARRSDREALAATMRQRDDRRTSIEAEVGRLDEDVRYALDHGRRDFAAQIIGRQLDLEAELAASLAADRGDEAARDRLAEEVEGLIARRAAMAATMAAPATVSSPSAPLAGAESAQAAFDRALALRPAGPATGNGSALTELDQLKRQEAIEARLAKLSQPAPSPKPRRRRKPN